MVCRNDGIIFVALLCKVKYVAYAKLCATSFELVVRYYSLPSSGFSKYPSTSKKGRMNFVVCGAAPLLPGLEFGSLILL